MMIICSQVPLFLFAFTREREGFCNLINVSDNIDPEFILQRWKTEQN